MVEAATRRFHASQLVGQACFGPRWISRRCCTAIGIAGTFCYAHPWQKQFMKALVRLRGGVKDFVAIDSDFIVYLDMPMRCPKAAGNMARLRKGCERALVNMPSDQPHMASGAHGS